MSQPKIPAFDLTHSEKVMLGAFIRGTQIANPDDPNNLWTKEALTVLQALLDGTADLPLQPTDSAVIQDLFCIFSDLLVRKETGQKDQEFTRIIAKFMHYLVSVIAWSDKRKKRLQPGPRTSAQISIEVPRAEEDLSPTTESQ